MAEIKNKDLKQVSGGFSHMIYCPSCGQQFDAAQNIDTSSGIYEEQKNGASLQYEYVCPHCGHRFC